MTEPRFVLDEHLSTAFATGLRRRGIDAVTFAEAGRAGYRDEDQFMWAATESLIIITHDDDYIALARATTDTAGIAFCHSNKYAVGGIIHALQTALRDLPTAEDWHGRVVFL